MTPEQSRMARAALKWSLDDLAGEAGIGRATIARFEAGENVADRSIEAMEAAFARHRVRLVKDGAFAGALYKGLRKAN